jgi:hypothetical protein
LIARTAESHATAAMQVSASTEEQSAACEQMSMASTQLFHGSHVLLDLVGELKTATPVTTVKAEGTEALKPPRSRTTPPHPSPQVKRVA